MGDKSNKNNFQTENIKPRVIADFGGRRRILDRRRKQEPIHHTERRCGTERRSGFDRRGALTQIGIIKSDKRHKFNTIEQLSKKLNNVVE
jgi:hypothetical protein